MAYRFRDFVGLSNHALHRGAVLEHHALRPSVPVSKYLTGYKASNLSMHNISSSAPQIPMTIPSQYGHEACHPLPTAKGPALGRFPFLLPL